VFTLLSQPGVTFLFSLVLSGAQSSVEVAPKEKNLAVISPSRSEVVARLKNHNAQYQ
jgi:hypothetical protein